MPPDLFTPGNGRTRKDSRGPRQMDNSQRPLARTFKFTMAFPAMKRSRKVDSRDFKRLCLGDSVSRKRCDYLGGWMSIELLRGHAPLNYSFHQLACTHHVEFLSQLYECVPHSPVQHLKVTAASDQLG
ncbi:uncharacterized protein LOC144158366 isoform X1 [Haemaphysalis longicornis]